MFAKSSKGSAEDQEKVKGQEMAKGRGMAKGRVREREKVKDQARCHPVGSQPLHFRIYRKHTSCSRHEQTLNIESDSQQVGTQSGLAMTAPSSLAHRQHHR